MYPVYTVLDSCMQHSKSIYIYTLLEGLTFIAVKLCVRQGAEDSKHSDAYGDEMRTGSNAMLESVTSLMQHTETSTVVSQHMHLTSLTGGCVQWKATQALAEGVDKCSSSLRLIDYSSLQMPRTQSVLGTGGSAQVLAAHWRGKSVAIKILTPMDLTPEVLSINGAPVDSVGFQVVRAALREADLLRQLAHPAVCVLSVCCLSMWLSVCSQCSVYQCAVAQCAAGGGLSRRHSHAAVDLSSNGAL